MLYILIALIQLMLIHLKMSMKQRIATKLEWQCYSEFLNKSTTSEDSGAAVDPFGNEVEVEVEILVSPIALNSNDVNGGWQKLNKN